MTWLKTIPASEDENVRRAVDAQRDLYPTEYAIRIHPAQDGQTSEIVASQVLCEDSCQKTKPRSMYLLTDCKQRTLELGVTVDA